MESIASRLPWVVKTVKRYSDMRHFATSGPLPLSLAGDLAIRAGEMRSRPPVTVLADATVAEAAKVMDLERVGSVLVRGEPGKEPSAILTDRDLRRRVLAHGRSPETPVKEVMSSPLVTLEADAPVSEALLIMLRARVRHLPLTDEGRIVGVLSHSDLLYYHLKSPGYLLERVLEAESVADLGAYVDELAAMVEKTARGGLGGAELCRLVAAINDALAAHLIDLAVGDLGPPPCAFSWIVFGSEGRREQALITDQDNALVLEEESPEARSYFERLAERVIGDLIRIGFPPCAGGYMATHWCHSLEGWVARIREWGERPEPEAMMHVATLFDFRPVRGELDLAPIEDAIRAVASDGIVLRQLARESMRMRPPIGFLRRIRQRAEGVDLKSGAILPIASLARVFALEAGDRQGSTLRRLRTARRAGLLNDADEESLRESFRFVFDLRLRLQLAARARGEPAGNTVRLEELSAGERKHLKEAMLAIRDHQTAAAHHYGLDLTG